MKKCIKIIICVGLGPMDGCGAELTHAEHRLFGETCECCALDWEERVRSWRFGRPDPDLDQYFDEDRRVRPAAATQPVHKAAA